MFLIKVLWQNINPKKPQDSIDRACLDFKQCYRCLKEEHGSTRPCIGEEVGYQMDLVTYNGKKSIKCLNKENSCRYNVCQCDKMLAEKLAEFEPQWDSSLHSVKVLAVF